MSNYKNVARNQHNCN